MVSSLAAPEKIWTELHPTRQKTLKESIQFSGVGLFSGEKVSLSICPAKENTGIVFQRTDLPGNPLLFAHLDQVVRTPRCTILGNQQFTVQTVEHVLAALKGLGIDNATLEIQGPEVPIMDGSANPFVEAILASGIEEQERDKKIVTLKQPVSWSSGDVHLVAIPSDHYQISYTLHFPQSALLKSQFHSATITPEYFINEIAPCRTFCLYEEIEPFIKNGMIKGGGLDNTVIIKNDVVINPDGIRFSDEMGRHKILDIIGDLSLLPFDLKCHIIAIRSGHASNIAFARELFKFVNLQKGENT